MSPECSEGDSHGSRTGVSADDRPDFCDHEIARSGG